MFTHERIVEYWGILKWTALVDWKFTIYNVDVRLIDNDIKVDIIILIKNHDACKS